MKHEWVQTLETIPSFAACKNCGKDNSAKNLNKECRPALTLQDIDNYLNALWC